MPMFLVETKVTEIRHYVVEANSVGHVHQIYEDGFGSFEGIEQSEPDEEPMEEIVRVVPA